MRRVVITGIGIVSSVGLDPESFWESNKAGRSGVSRIECFDTTGFDVNFAGEVKAFDPLKWISKRDEKRIDRFAQFAIAAADQAVCMSGLDFAKEDRTRIGTIVGSGIGGLNEYETQHRRLIERGPSTISAFLIPKLMVNAGAGQVAIRYGLNGPSTAIATACASANHSIGDAFRLVRYGDADVMLAGGAEAAITPTGIGGFAALRALSTRNDNPPGASRPFDKDRDGFVMGEGGAMFVLEEYERAKQRGASILAEFRGFGMTSDGSHITAPDPEGAGAARSMEGALKDGGIDRSEVDYINAHGTSTPLNDAIETRAIKRVFGERAKRIPISSTKSMIGHCLGASGALELVACCLAIRDDVAPPTINYTTPDPECDLDFVPNQARPVPIRVVLSNSFGFGGHNATLAISKLRDRA
ncbi:MAG: beta-ketoacyl-ACP synthase II [Planctomycetota bacterium]